MKPTLLALKCVSALALASVSQSYSQIVVDKTTSISQADADSETRYDIGYPTFGNEQKTYHFNLTENITFGGYFTSSGDANGNVFHSICSQYSQDFHQTLISGNLGGTKSNLVFNNNKTEKTGVAPFSNARHAYGGAASFGHHIFKDFGNVIISNNSIHNTSTDKNTPQSSGGGIKTNSLNLDNIDNFVVQGNRITGHGGMFGGGICAHGNITTGTMDPNKTTGYGNIIPHEGTGTGNISFINNGCIVSGRSDDMNGYGLYGGALYSGGASFWYNTGRILFQGNFLSYDTSAPITGGSKPSGQFNGGAYYALSAIYFRNTLNIAFDNNYTDTSFNTEQSWSYGGAIYNTEVYFIDVRSENENEYALSFTNNRAITNNLPNSVGRGGAIVTARMQIVDSGNTLFANNYATGVGGAIYIRNMSGKSYQSVFTANQGDITFIGNTDSLGTTERNSGKSNAIYVAAANASGVSSGNIPQLFIRATEGHAVNFYDPITSDNLDRSNFYLYLNSGGDEYTGDLLFSGRYVKDSLAGSEGTADYEQRVADSKKTDVNANIYLYNGKLTLEEGVTLGRKFDEDNPGLGTGAYFWMSDNATLDISGSAENGTTTIAGRFISLNEGVVKIGNMSRFDANDIYIEEGFKLDMGYYFTPNTARQLGISQAEHSGLQITAESMELGGSIQLLDSRDEYFYTDIFWAEDRRFIIFDAASVNPENIDGDFEGIISELTESNIVDDTYQRQGIWSLEWEDGQLVALWQNTNPEIEEIRPEMDGTAMLNTLWSSASNVQAMSRAGASQMGIHRFKYGKDRNFWGQGLADFSSHGRRGGRDGYDYNGGGYAVGMDEKITPNIIAGLGFGQLKGNNRSRGYNIKTDQNTLMGMLYTGYNKQLSQKNNLDIQLIGVYGNTNNKSRTVYNRGTSHGEWDNNTWMLDLYATWTRDLGNNWSLTPYIGLEYTEAKQQAFTETGFAARQFGKDKLQNLSSPVGVGLQKHITFANGMHWTGELKTSYVPDLYRKNPETCAVWLDQDYTWYAKGVAPVRNAFRIEYNNRLQLSQRWAVYGGYMYEGRRNANYHQVNLGASYSF